MSAPIPRFLADEGCDFAAVRAMRGKMGTLTYFRSLDER